VAVPGRGEVSVGVGTKQGTTATMALYDREYYRDERQRDLSFRNMTAISQLLIVNIVLFVANLLFTHSDNAITGFLTLRPDDLVQPWLWWRLVSYGFVHSPENLFHILMNMFVLWMFGREIEAIYGRGEFFRIYLASIVLGGLLWTIRQSLFGVSAAGLLGASGGVTTIFLLFVCRFPHRTILLMFIPVPAWLAGILFVLADISGMQAAREGGSTAYDVHLMGAAFGFFYWWSGMRLSWLGVPRRWLPTKALRRPSLRVHDPKDSDSYQELEEQADAILEKVNRSGVESLSPSERRILEAYSRYMQRKRR
jgi:membrane associated rhomboid family serine protease